ncbi:MAG: transglycosylase domain-containing protein [Clostridia bacterium]|nr:transglycosylase domain-containing protein [Clostridia bacterium]
MKILKKLLKIFLLLLLLTIFFFIGYYFSVTKDVALSPEKLTINENTAQIYDANDKEFANASTLVAQEITRIADIPEHTKWAFIDTEDRSFFSHNGFNVKRIVKALLNNLKSASFKEGASTISQQLIKNTHLSQQKTIKRKLQEFKLTYQLEKNYSKEDILEKYLNTIYFGHSCFGITSASKFYFGKPPSELTLSESAILAGMVKSPNNYSPFKKPEKCENRRNVVLNGMREMRHISDEQVNQAKLAPLPDSPTLEKGNKHYISAVFDEIESLSEQYNFSVGGKISIHTYLNEDLQDFLESQAKNIDCDCVFSVLDNLTHGISAYYKTAKINARSPASLIKPLAVYAPAIEENLLCPATPLLDEKINFSGYEPKNFDGNYYGYISARQALSKSLNIPAVKLLNSLGVKKSAQYLEKLSLSITEEDKTLALALGGIQNGFTLNQLIGAYSSFACNGIYTPPSFIRKIYIDGEVVYSRKIIESQVFSDSTAFLITDMLRTAVKDGTAKKLRALPFDIAAKTGTNGVEGKNLDAYTISYTTANTVGVWLGNASNAPIEYTGGGKPCDIVYKINERINEISPFKENITPFLQPDSVKIIKIDSIEYENSKKILLADPISPSEFMFQELFQESLIPTQQAAHFSNPKINSPKIQLTDKKINITFDINAPKFYKIIVKKYYASRNTYVTHSTLYEGSIPEHLTDILDDDRVYVYSVTPYYKDIAGNTIFLPSVSLSGNKSPILPDSPPNIIKKDWWNY